MVKNAAAAAKNPKKMTVKKSKAAISKSSVTVTDKQSVKKPVLTHTDATNTQSPKKKVKKSKKSKLAKGILKKKSTEAKEDGFEDDAVVSGKSEVKHAALLKAIQSLDGKKAPISQRNETALSTSEYHNRDTKKVRFGQLLRSLDASNDLNVKKYIQQQDGTRKLPEPVEKIHVKKAEREVKYTETKAEVDKWQSIVEDNRVAPQLQFPMERSRISVPSSKREAQSHQPRTALEFELQALLKGPDYVAEQAERAAKPMLTLAEQQVMKSMDVARAKEELALRRKHRRMVSDMAAKNKRQGKIKSRSYHRHLKAERRKTAYKALEKLKAEDPEVWKEKAEEIERARIEERATLRHKGKSKFAKLATRYGKFNEKIKDSLDEMRSKGVQLMTKQAQEESSSDSEDEQRADVDMEDSDEEREETTTITSSQNPWMSGKLSKERVSEPLKKAEPLLITHAFGGDSSEDEANPVETVSHTPTLSSVGTVAKQTDNVVSTLPDNLAHSQPAGEGAADTSGLNSSPVKVKFAEISTDTVTSEVTAQTRINLTKTDNPNSISPAKSAKRTKTEVKVSEKSIVKSKVTDRKVSQAKNSVTKPGAASQSSGKTTPKKSSRKSVTKPGATPKLDTSDSETRIGESRMEAIAAAEELQDDADELVQGQTTLRIQTRGDVDKFDDQFHMMSSEQAANQEVSDESSDEEEVVISTQNIDPKKVISIPSTDLSAHVNPSAEQSDSEDDQHRLNIAEAFADDDVVEEFSARRKRKFDEEDAAADATAALNVLPGWGSWAGAGVEEKGSKPRSKMSRWEKEKRRIENLKKAARAAEVAVAREKQWSKYPKGVIINEKALQSQPISKYQVDPKRISYKPSAFSAMMSHPIGKEFVPTIAHNELCKPKVVTAVGTIIAPMNKDMVTEANKQTFPKSTADPQLKLAKQYELQPMRKKPKNLVRSRVKVKK